MNKTFYGETIFPIEKIDRLKTYKYSGSDASLLYKYFYGRSAQFLIDNIIPPTIA